MCLKVSYLLEYIDYKHCYHNSEWESEREKDLIICTTKLRFSLFHLVTMLHSIIYCLSSSYKLFWRLPSLSYFSTVFVCLCTLCYLQYHIIW